MRTIVKKFGGSTLESIKDLRNVVSIVQEYLAKIDRIIIVVSARGRTTDQLILNVSDLISIDTYETRREYDKYLAVGEQESASTMSLMLLQNNIRAISLLGWQIPIVTDDNYTNASIEDIDVSSIYRYLEEYHVVIIAGFQGMCRNFHITTLGRNGSDMTAIFLSLKMGLECYIYSDVNGIYTADPKIICSAEICTKMSYDEMLPMVASGLNVLNYRAFDMAYQHNLTLRFMSKDCKQYTKLAGESKKVKVISPSLKESCVLLKVNDSISEYIKFLSDNKIRIFFTTGHMGEMILVVDSSFLKYKGPKCTIIQKDLSMITILAGFLSDPMHHMEDVMYILSSQKINLVMHITYGDRLIFVVSRDELHKALKYVYEYAQQTFDSTDASIEEVNCFSPAHS
ncbi:MAG: aspartokinase [Candidatus Xenolissoclinum pacificiensis L6]|uniref:aspartate kinase n=1 Tax=Candidatus Xenolissoclinum pacificiensis L6 TaxID=1401685 RepID=W2UZN4_9RICK|nr:MAG: aspartokinase [Candidatus Xenolissoclinum pacificiensis L6]